MDWLFEMGELATLRLEPTLLTKKTLEIENRLTNDVKFVIISS
jgi:hypothetical protein